MTTLKNFKKCYFRKMADEKGIVAANWASYHVSPKIQFGSSKDCNLPSGPYWILYGPILYGPHYMD